MTGITDRLNWDFVGRGNYQAVATSTNPRSNSGIPRQQFPISSGASILMLGCRSATASTYWRLGCWASQILMVLPSTTSTFLGSLKTKRIACQLGAFTLLEFTDYQAGTWILEIDIPRWIDQLEVEIWYYSGDQLNPTLRDLEAIKNHLGI